MTQILAISEKENTRSRIKTNKTKDKRISFALLRQNKQKYDEVKIEEKKMFYVASTDFPDSIPVANDINLRTFIFGT